jgi:hypothetical protein
VETSIRVPNPVSGQQVEALCAWVAAKLANGEAR